MGMVPSTAVIDLDPNARLGIPVMTNVEGWYTVAGETAAVVAVSLAANTPLMSARLAAGSTRRAFLYKFELVIAPATLGVAAAIAGTIGLQRFTAATPTGGTARTANRQTEAFGAATDMTDIRDSNAALTVAGVVFGNIVAKTLVPLFVTVDNAFVWTFKPDYPTILVPGDGLCLRTVIVMPATQTWVYSYNMEWTEGPIVR